MRCHEILEVTERAGQNEVDAAYRKKRDAVWENNVLSDVARNRKLNELAQAREDCLSWMEKDGSTRFVARVDEARKRATDPNRLNACCCCDCGDCCNSVISCCTWCNNLECGDCIAFILGVGGLCGIVAFLFHLNEKEKEAEVQRRREAEEAARSARQREEEAAVRMQQTLRSFSQRLDSILSRITSESLSLASAMINACPSVPDSIHVSLEDARQFANAYHDRIYTQYQQNLAAYRLAEADDCLRFLIDIGFGDLQAQSDKLRPVLEFVNRNRPSILSSGGDGTLNEEYIEHVQSVPFETCINVGGMARRG